MREQAGRVRVPVHFYLTGEVGHRVGLDPHAGHAELLAFDHHGAGATEGVQHALPGAYPEPPRIVADEMRREREDEAVPVVDGTVLGRQLVDGAVAVTALG